MLIRACVAPISNAAHTNAINTYAVYDSMFAIILQSDYKSPFNFHQAEGFDLRTFSDFKFYFGFLGLFLSAVGHTAIKTESTK